MATDAPWQKVRYLCVDNQTGEDIRVYVKCDDGQTRYWDFAADQKANLAIDNEKIAAGELCVWATSANKTWLANQDEPLQMVPQPYRSASIGTHTQIFR